MDDQLVVNTEGVSGKLGITDAGAGRGLNIKVNHRKSPAPSLEDSADSDSAYSNSMGSYPRVDELANPEKVNVQRHRSYSPSVYSTQKKRKRHARSRTPANRGTRPSAGFSSLKEERLHLCLSLKRLKDEGVKGISDFDENTSIEELRMELRALEDDELVRNGIQNCRSALVTISAGIEIANRRYNPFDLDLNGWSQNLYESVETFDGVFERLTKKYSRRVGSIAPEAQLLIMLASNAFSFCFMRSMLKACEPSMTKVAADNPELVRQMMSSIAQQAAPEPPPRFGLNVMPPFPPGAPPISTRGNFVPQPPPEPEPPKQQPPREPTPAKDEPPPVTGPDQAKLNALVQKAQRIVTAESSDATSSLMSFDSVSFDDGSTVSSLPKKRGRKPKKALNVIDL